MKLTKVGVSELAQTKEVAGLLTCEVKYEVKGGKGRLVYAGPKFDTHMWHQVLSFFRWTYQEMDSESQVRLYVNTKLGRWGAWAFPQEARTGMNAREIAVKETPDQAIARFASWDSAPSDDWVYFSTVHHHCSASAFQSGTDESNEQNQDGLHITMGKMGNDRHDLHARFYLAGNCFEPDLSLFWPIDDNLVDKIPGSMLDELARYQMCQKVVVDFPDEWRKNVIELKRERKPERKNGFDGLWDHEFQVSPPAWARARDALGDLERDGRINGYADEDIIQALTLLGNDSVERAVLYACVENRILPEDLLGEIEPSQVPF
jgi:hypothetical protein